MVIDKKDARILSLLQQDGRISWSKLAEKVSLSASACQRRVESLIEKGIIENFSIYINERALGNTVKAFVSVNIDRQNTDLAERFREEVLQHPKIQTCHMISGNIDFLLEVVAHDLKALGDFIHGELLAMPAVKDASSSIVLKIVKKKQVSL